MVKARNSLLALLASMVAVAAIAPRPAGPRASSSSGAALSDSGVFVVRVGGREIGKEKFNIRWSGDSVEARAEVELHVDQEGKVSTYRIFPELILNTDLQPLTYTWRQKGPQSSSLEVDFRSSPAQTRYKTVAGDLDRRDFVLSKDVVILDDNVIHHYELTVARFRQSAGDKQTFQAFVPQEALPGTLTIEDTGAGSVEIHGRSERLQHLVVTTELARVELWVDDHQKLQMVSIPAAQFEAVRQ